MTTVVPGIFIISVFLLASWIIFGSLLSTSTDQVTAMDDARERYAERLRTNVNVASTSVSVVTLTTGDCANSYLAVDTTLANSGDVSIEDFSQVDLVMLYTNATGGETASHPGYVTGSLANGKWTVSSINPDNFGVNIWDPDERATLRARPNPLPKSQSTGTVLVATPQGVFDSAYVEFDFTDPVSNDCRYLHNNPTPPTGDTDQQSFLTMDETTPTAATLYNYDQDVDTNPGRTIVKGAVGVGETDATKYQVWRTGVLADSLTLSGTVAVDLWGAIQNYQQNKEGIVTIFVRDYDGSSHTEINQGTMYSADWQSGSSSFVRKVILIPGFDYTIPAGNELEIKVIVGNLAASEMWFAYDTQTYQSLVNLSYVPPTFTTLYYLHNDPTPATADTDAQSPLPLDTNAPTGVTLYNYDQNYDADAGRILQKTPLGLSESQLQKHQVWRSGSLAGDLAITGDVTIDLWGAIKDFGQDQTGIVTVYLRDYNGSTHTEIGNGTVYAADWQDGASTWVKRSIFIPELGYTVSSGDELEVFMVVENSSGSDMWFAYDTTAYPSVVKIP